MGVVSLHEIQPYLGEPYFAQLVIARDILYEDFPRLTPDQSLTCRHDLHGQFAAIRLQVHTEISEKEILPTKQSPSARFCLAKK